MTFPQPSSDAPVLQSQQYFRLKTGLSSAGDLYESKVGALAFALGPDSDLASVNVTYLDVAAQSAESFILSPDRAFVGRIDARNDVDYPNTPGNRKGRILISSNDMFDDSARPDGYVDADDVIYFVQPTLDVMQYFVNPPSVMPERSDKIFRFLYYPGAQDIVNGVSYLAVPGYGRKSGHFLFRNLNGINTVRVKVFGWKLSTSAAPGTVGAVQSQLYSGDLLTQGTGEYFYLASADGMWDLFLISLGGGAAGFGYDPASPMPTTITLSDDPL